jgi:hypothetical protein
LGALCPGGNVLHIKRGYWVSGGNQKGNLDCPNITTFETCNQKGAIDGINATVKVNSCRQIQSEIGLRYTEYYDVCNVKRKISPCGLVDEDPKCEVHCSASDSAKCRRAIPCQACWNKASTDTVIESTLNMSSFINSKAREVCNANEGYSGRLCQRCLTGFARDSSMATKCTKCQTTGVNYVLIFLGVMVAMVFLSLFIHVNMKVAGSSSTSGAAQKNLFELFTNSQFSSKLPIAMARICENYV